MKNSQKGFIVPLLSAIIALLVIGGGGYFYTQNKNLQKQIDQNKILENNIAVPTTTTTQTTTTVNNTSNLKTYTNTKYGFSFQYPSDWMITVKDESTEGIGGATVRKSLPDGYVLSVDLGRTGAAAVSSDSNEKTTFLGREAYIGTFNACISEGANSNLECNLRTIRLLLNSVNGLVITYGVSKTVSGEDHITIQKNLTNIFNENIKIFQEILDSIKIQNQTATSNVPVINSLSSNKGASGEAISIYGSNFIIPSTSNGKTVSPRVQFVKGGQIIFTINLNGIGEYPFTSSQVRFQVPYAKNTLDLESVKKVPGIYQIYIENWDGNSWIPSNSVDFTITGSAAG